MSYRTASAELGKGWMDGCIGIANPNRHGMNINHQHNKTPRHTANFVPSRTIHDHKPHSKSFSPNPLSTHSSPHGATTPIHDFALRPPPPRHVALATNRSPNHSLFPHPTFPSHLRVLAAYARHGRSRRHLGFFHSILSSFPLSPSVFSGPSRPNIPRCTCRRARRLALALRYRRPSRRLS